MRPTVDSPSPGELRRLTAPFAVADDRKAALQLADTLLPMAARNIVIAEKMGMDIALECNGCYKSIYEVNHILKHNDQLRDMVNEVLKR